jgi:hypothetical protein
MRKIYATAGALVAEDFRLALPHEHIFTETGDAPAWAYRDANAGNVLRVMKPHLLAAFFGWRRGARIHADDLFWSQTANGFRNDKVDLCVQRVLDHVVEFLALFY